MNKLLVSVAIFAASVVAVNAQESSFKPDAGSVGFEIAFSPLDGAAGFQQGFSFDENVAGQLKLYYYVSDNFAIRLGLGYNAFSMKYDNGESGDDLRKRSSRYSTYAILPGIVYSFDGTSRFAPYVGAEFGIGSTSLKEVIEMGKIEGTFTNDPDEGNFLNTFAFNVFTGFNYFIAKNLFLGVEVGIGYESVSLKDYDEKVTGNPDWKAPEKDKSSSSMSFFGLKTQPMLRLGWFF